MVRRRDRVRVTDLGTVAGATVGAMAEARGVDVSHWQTPGARLTATIRQAMGGRAPDFAFMKASQGGRSRDPKMVDHHSAFGATGTARGAYHFYDFGASPSANASNFARAMAGLKWELRPVLDAEHGGAGSRSATATALLDFLRAVTEAVGVRPIVYTYASWWNATVEPSPLFLNYPLWIARYPSSLASGAFPGPGKTTPPARPWPAWAAWQFSTAGNLDRNVTHDLAALSARPGATPPPTTDTEIFTMDTEAKNALDAISKKVQTLLDQTPTRPAPVRGPDGKVWVITPAGRWHVPDAETLDTLIFLGQVHGYGSKGVAQVGDDFLDGIPVLPAPK